MVGDGLFGIGLGDFGGGEGAGSSWM